MATSYRTFGQPGIYGDPALLNYNYGIRQLKQSAMNNELNVTELKQDSSGNVVVTGENEQLGKVVGYIWLKDEDGNYQMGDGSVIAGEAMGKAIEEFNERQP